MLNSRKKAGALLAAAVAPALAMSHASASPITSGDLVVYRVGDGTTALTSAGSPVFLDEYSPTGTLVQSIPMPSTAATGNNLIASGTATSEGLLTISPNGQFIALTGYDRALGGTGSLASTTSSAVPRTVGIVNVDSGAVDVSTALTDFASGNNPRSAVTTDGNSIWVAGAGSSTATAVGYTTLGSSTTTAVVPPSSSTLTNARQINIFGGQLYVSSGSGSFKGINAIGTGTPSTSGQTTALSVPDSLGSPYSYYFADSSPTVPGLDTLYIADDTSSTGGIEKFSLVGGSWVAEGINTSAGSARGLTGVTNPDGTVTLYATTGGSSATGGGTLWSLTDSGYDTSINSSTVTTLATAGNDEAFRGVVYVPEPASAALLLLAGGGLMFRRRRTN